MWTGSLVVPERGGYGVMKGRKAHRISYELHVGPIPTDKYVCHTCDNPPCVNPSHLWLGDVQSNTADMVSKGRNQMGEDRHNAKLTNDKVREIRELRGEGVSQADLARRFQVNPATISGIVRRKDWKHVT
jgi:hypothetical protein